MELPLLLSSLSQFLRLLPQPLLQLSLLVMTMEHPPLQSWTAPQQPAPLQLLVTTVLLLLVLSSQITVLLPLQWQNLWLPLETATAPLAPRLPVHTMLHQSQLVMLNTTGETGHTVSSEDMLSNLNNQPFSLQEEQENSQPSIIVPIFLTYYLIYLSILTTNGIPHHILSNQVQTASR